MISELVCLESRDLPESTFSFWKGKTSAPAAPTDVALLPVAESMCGPAADDAVTVTCQLQKSPECGKTFTGSTSRRLALKDLPLVEPSKYPSPADPAAN